MCIKYTFVGARCSSYIPACSKANAARDESIKKAIFHHVRSMIGIVIGHDIDPESSESRLTRFIYEEEKFSPARAASRALTRRCESPRLGILPMYSRINPFATARLRRKALAVDEMR